MKTEVARKNRDMHDYIKEGETLYDILGRYVPELEGDYSAANLVNKSIELIDSNTNGEKEIIELYQQVFLTVSQQILSCIEMNENNNSNTQFSKEKQDELLNKLIEIDKEVGYVDYYDTLNDYVINAAKNMTDSSTKAMRDQIVISGIDLLGNEEKENLRGVLFLNLYIGDKVSKYMKKKYPTMQEREDPNNKEWQDYKIMEHTLNNQEDRIWYDKYLQKYKNDLNIIRDRYFKLRESINDAEERETTNCTEQHRLEEKRAYKVRNILWGSLTDEEKKLATRIGGIVNVILGDPYSYSVPPEGTYEWEFKEKKPEIVFDGFANYSENGIENQRVVAVSYGNLYFETDFIKRTNEPLKSSSALELIGVTRKGNDGEKNYFIFTELNLKDSKDDSIISIPEENFEINKTNRIPKEQEDFYAKIFLSDLYLDATTESYSRSTGIVYTNNSGKTRIIPDLTKDYYNIRALKYANKYASKWISNVQNAERVYTIEEIVTSKHFEKLQEKISRQLFKAGKSENPKTFINMEEGEDR